MLRVQRPSSAKLKKVKTLKQAVPIPHFLDLPPELGELITESLDARSLATLACVSQQLSQRTVSSLTPSHQPWLFYLPSPSSLDLLITSKQGMPSAETFWHTIEPAGRDFDERPSQHVFLQVTNMFVGLQQAKQGTDTHQHAPCNHLGGPGIPWGQLTYLHWEHLPCTTFRGLPVHQA